MVGWSWSSFSPTSERSVNEASSLFGSLIPAKCNHSRLNGRRSRMATSVHLPAGPNTAHMVVKPIRDEQKEPIETVLVAVEGDPSLGPIAPSTVGKPSKAAAAIPESDEPPPAGLRTADGLFHLCLPG